MPLALLGELVSVGTLFAFALVCAGVVPAPDQPDLPRPFRSPASRMCQSPEFSFCLYLIAGLPFDTQMRLVVWLALGMVVYFGYSRYHSKLFKASEGSGQSP